MTIFAISTPPGIGGIAVIRISGPSAIIVADTIFQPRRASHTLSLRPTHTVTFGQLIDPQSKQVIDEVVATVFRGPHSFTGEDVVEISCHGSIYIQRCIIEVLSSLNSEYNIRIAEPGEFTRRAFSNGLLDLTQAEAVADLISAQNAASHRLAMNQMKGSISRKLDELHDQLLKLSSLLELELDFSEEDVEFADRTQLTQLALDIDSEITSLTSSFQTGQAIRNGVPVAIIGAPNVGKSTLLNALLRDDRAIVSDIQGTTRDLIEDTIQLQGILFRFIDTAGIRNTDDRIEKMGIERSLQAASRARIIILLTEPGVDYPEIKYSADQTVIRVINKSDKLQTSVSIDSLQISALHNTGIDLLEQRLVESSGLKHVQGDLILTNQRHYQSLTEAHEAIQRVISGIRLPLSADLIAEELHSVIEPLNSILGRSITSQDTLINIFSHFCIGK